MATTTAPPKKLTKRTGRQAKKPRAAQSKAVADQAVLPEMPRRSDKSRPAKPRHESVPKAATAGTTREAKSSISRNRRTEQPPAITPAPSPLPGGRQRTAGKTQSPTALSAAPLHSKPAAPRAGAKPRTNRKRRVPKAPAKLEAKTVEAKGPAAVSAKAKKVRLQRKLAPHAAPATAPPLNPRKRVAVQDIPPKKRKKQQSNAKTARSPAVRTPLAKQAGAQVASSPALKATKKRAPTDLAEQYTEKTKKPSRKKPQTTKLARVRRSTEERARVQQLMDPSDELMRRLARIGAISTSLAATEDQEDGAPRRSRAHYGKVLRRPRRWELTCGKCGHKGQFTTAAAVCPRCGTITVRI